VLVAEEEHDGERVVELVHLVEVGHLVDVAEVDHGKVLDLVGDAVEYLILAHAVRVPVAPEAYHDESVVLGHDGLVHVPAGFEVREDDGAHGFSLFVSLFFCFFVVVEEEEVEGGSWR